MSSEQHLKLIIYGASGKGKTYFVGSIMQVPEMLPAFILDTEGGLRTIRSSVRRLSSVREIGKDVSVDKMDAFSPANSNDVFSTFEILSKLLKGPTPTYRTVIIDSLSELGSSNIIESSRIGIDRDRKGSHDPVLPDQQDYGRSNLQMRIIVKSFTNLSCNLICTASSNEKTAADGTVTIEPDFVGQLVDRIPRLFDVVGYLYTKSDPKGSWRVLSVGPRRNTFTKYRGEKGTPSDIENPTMKLLIEKMEEIEGNPVIASSVN